MKQLLSILASILTTTSLFAATFYVNSARPDDSGDGLSWATAKKTIQAAVDATVDGDTVLVTNGVYNTGVTVTPGFSLNNRVVITKGIAVQSVNGAEVTIIEGSGVEHFGLSSAIRGVYMSKGVLDGFTIQNGTTFDTLETLPYYSAENTGGGICMVSAAANTKVRNCAIRYNSAPGGGGVSEGYLENCTVSNNSSAFGGGVFYATLVSCIVVSNSASGGGGTYRSSATNCLIVGNNALNDGGGSCQDYLYNCTIVRNTGRAGAGSYQGTLKNCVMAENRYQGFDNNHYESTFDYSCTIPLPPGTGNIDSDPLFIDAASGNFRLRADSPCRDVGNNAYVQGSADLEGAPRILNGTVDMGAYEATAINTLTYDFEETPLSSAWKSSGSGNPWVVETRTGTVHGGSRALAVGSTGGGYDVVRTSLEFPSALVRGRVSWWFYDENAGSTPYYLRTFLLGTNGFRIVNVSLLDSGYGDPGSTTFQLEIGDQGVSFGTRTVGWHKAKAVVGATDVTLYIDDVLAFSNAMARVMTAIEFEYHGCYTDSHAALYDDLTIQYDMAESRIVTFDARGGAVDPTSQMFNVDAPYGTLPTPTRAGHAFCGWWTEAGGDGTQVTDTTVVGATSLTVYAFWVPTNQPVVWNPTTEFCVTNGNPNGVWSYGHMDAAFGAFSLYETGDNSGVANSPIWYDVQTEYPPFGSVFVNTSDATVYGVGPDQLSLHPCEDGAPATVRWTAPSNLFGYASITGQFFAGHSGVMTVGVRFNGCERWAATDEGPFSIATMVAPGDVLDFVVYGSFNAGSTPLDATITVNRNRYNVTFEADGGEVAPVSRIIAYGACYGALPVPSREGSVFSGWWTGVDGTGVEISEDTEVTATDDHTLYAKWIRGLPPRITRRSPAAGLISINEGASVGFSATANDSSDPDATGRGMSNIVWYVDGVRTQETRVGAPNSITSAFNFKTAAKTVSDGATVRDIAVSAVALDREGLSAETNWTVRVTNVLTSQKIAFGGFPVKVLGDADFAPGATTSSGLAVQYASSNEQVAEIVEGMIRILEAGKAVITASQPGNFDFKAATPVKQTLTVKARLATETVGGGSVTGAGLYLPGTKVALTARPAAGNTFLRWEDGSQKTARSYVMPATNAWLGACFGITTNVPPPEVDDPVPPVGMVGVPLVMPLSIRSESLPRVTVSGLPSGLRFDAASNTVAGVPTVAVTGRLVTVTARNVNKTSTVKRFTMTVEPLPVWAQGRFVGWFVAGESDFGSVSADVTAQGKVTGKLASVGTNYTFRATSYARRDGDGAFWFAADAKAGKAVRPLTFAVRNPAGVEPAGLSVAEGWFGVVADGDSVARLYRNVWMDAGMVAFLTNTYAGYYTATLPGGAEYGSGYLTFTVDKAGGVKTVGKLADGTAVSLSGTLVLDEAGRVFAVLYTAPAAYKGGSVFGLVEFYETSESRCIALRPLDAAFQWASKNPLATSEYGAGFARTLGLDGGWYDTVGNLYRYYEGAALSFGTDAESSAPMLAVGTNRYESAWWRPDNVALTVVTNRFGVLTGLSAPKVGVPVKDGGAYDYEGGTNTVGLSVTLARATGVFKGSFKAWFDYASTHLSKRVAVEGVFTPERNDRADGVEGRGFFLWADTGRYLNPAGKSVSYGYNGSYDLLILGAVEWP